MSWRPASWKLSLRYSTPDRVRPPSTVASPPRSRKLYTSRSTKVSGIGAAGRLFDADPSVVTADRDGGAVRDALHRVRQRHRGQAVLARQAGSVREHAAGLEDQS